MNHLLSYFGLVYARISASEKDLPVTKKTRYWLLVMLLTGKSLSEALILAATNPQYVKRLFIELRVQYMKTTSSEHVVYINCSECRNKNKKTTCVHDM